MDSTKRNWYLLPLRIIAAIVFLTAVVGKLFDYDSLYAAVSRLGWIPHLLDNTAAITLMVAELTAGVLLLSPRWNRVGGIVGSILSVLFITVTSYLRLSGISDDCACFGIFISLPPLAMLWIDVLLLLACGIVAMGGTAQSGAQRVPTNANRRILPYAVVTYSVLMLSALQIGLARDKERKAHSERPVVNLRFGDSAPRFSFTTNSGRVVTNQTIGGKWTLLCFVMGMCPPCEREVADISASYDTWKSQLDVFLILMDRPLLASAKRAAQNYASRLVKPIPVVTDVDGSIARLFADRPAVSPFSILLDPDGRVRFVQGGREEGEFALWTDPRF